MCPAIVLCICSILRSRVCIVSLSAPWKRRDSLLTLFSGNVGLSLGYPTVATSFSGQFSTFSKVVICAMMIRGRHRGLPYSLDRAILLPNDRLVANQEEAEEARPDARPYVHGGLSLDGSGRVKFRRSYTK